MTIKCKRKKRLGLLARLRRRYKAWDLARTRRKMREGIESW